MGALGTRVDPSKPHGYSHGLSEERDLSELVTQPRCVHCRKTERNPIHRVEAADEQPAG